MRYGQAFHKSNDRQQRLVGFVKSETIEQMQLKIKSMRQEGYCPYYKIFRICPHGVYR